MTTMKYWMMAIRPKTLMASIAPVILGLACAYALKSQINLITALLTLICAVLLQMATNLVNDYFDFIKEVDSHKRIGPDRVTSKGLICPSKIKKAFYILFGLAFFIGVYLSIVSGPVIFFIGIFSIIFAYIYTGGPWPLSYHALGELTALIFFGPIAVWGSFYIQAKSYELLPALVGLGPGFIAATIMAINNLRDRKSDMQTKKITLAIIIGEKNARLLCIFFIFCATMVPATIGHFQQNFYLLIPCITPLIFIKNWLAILKAPITSELNNYLAKTGAFLFIYSLVFSWALIA